MNKVLLILVMSFFAMNSFGQDTNHPKTKLTSAASGTMSMTYNNDKPDKDFKELKKVLTLDKFNSLTGFIFIKGLEGKELDGKSYNEILEESIEFEQEEKERLKEKKQKEKELKEKEMEKMVNEMYKKIEKEGK